MSQAFPAYIVDDDPSVRRSTKFLLDQLRRPNRAFADGETFLRAASELDRGIVLLDLKMPGVDGVEVHERLLVGPVRHQVIVITGHGDIAEAVGAMRRGAVDFLEKPYRREALLDGLERADAILRNRTTAFHVASEAKRMIDQLTPREQDVLKGLAEGLPNKSIAFDLGISPRTVEVHRANLMQKLGARSLSEALRLAFAAGEEEAS